MKVTISLKHIFWILMFAWIAYCFAYPFWEITKTSLAESAIETLIALTVVIGSMFLSVFVILFFIWLFDPDSNSPSLTFTLGKKKKPKDVIDLSFHLRQSLVEAARAGDFEREERLLKTLEKLES